MQKNEQLRHRPPMPGAAPYATREEMIALQGDQRAHERVCEERMRRIDQNMESVDRRLSDSVSDRVALRAKIETGIAEVREQMQAGISAVNDRMESGFRAINQRQWWFAALIIGGQGGVIWFLLRFVFQGR